MQVILKLFEKASSRKINLPKSQALWTGANKNRIDKPGQIALSKFSIKIIVLILLILLSMTSIGTK